MRVLPAGLPHVCADQAGVVVPAGPDHAHAGAAGRPPRRGRPHPAARGQPVPGLPRLRDGVPRRGALRRAARAVARPPVARPARAADRCGPAGRRPGHSGPHRCRAGAWRGPHDRGGGALSAPSHARLRGTLALPWGEQRGAAAAPGCGCPCRARVLRCLARPQRRVRAGCEHGQDAGRADAGRHPHDRRRVRGIPGAPARPPEGARASASTCTSGGRPTRRAGPRCASSPSTGARLGSGCRTPASCATGSGCRPPRGR